MTPPQREPPLRAHAQILPAISCVKSIPNPTDWHRVGIMERIRGGGGDLSPTAQARVPIPRPRCAALRPSTLRPAERTARGPSVSGRHGAHVAAPVRYLRVGVIGTGGAVMGARCSKSPQRRKHGRSSVALTHGRPTGIAIRCCVAVLLGRSCCDAPDGGCAAFSRYNAEVRQPGPVAVEPTDGQRARWGIPGAVVAGAFVVGTIALGVLGLLRWDRDSLGYGLVLVVGLAALFSMVRPSREHRYEVALAPSRLAASRTPVHDADAGVSEQALNFYGSVTTSVLVAGGLTFFWVFVGYVLPWLSERR